MRHALLLLPLLSAGALSAQYMTDELVAGIRAPRSENQAAMDLLYQLDDVSASYMRALDMIDRGVDEAALVHLDRMLEMSPNDVGGLLHRGETLARMGLNDQARADLLEVLALMPTGGGAHRALYRLGHIALAEGDLVGAHAQFDRLVAMAPDHAMARCDRGITNAALGRDEQALEDLQTVMATAPWLTQANAHLGFVLIRMDRKEEACAAFKRALQSGDRSVEEMLLVHCTE